jgi:hypothetical protein
LRQQRKTCSGMSQSSCCHIALIMLCGHLGAPNHRHNLAFLAAAGYSSPAHTLRHRTATACGYNRGACYCMHRQSLQQHLSCRQ